MNSIEIISLIAVAVAKAISVVPLFTTILILLSPNRTISAIPFLAGFVMQLFGITLAFIWGVTVLPLNTFTEKDPVGGVALLVIGVALVALATLSGWRSRSRTTTDLPKWLRSIGSAKPRSAFLVAISLNLRPKSILLNGSFAVLAHSASLNIVAPIVAVAGCTVIGASTVALPVIVTLAFPDRAQPVLVATRNWLVKYQAWVSALILFLIGAILIVESLARL